MINNLTTGLIYRLRYRVLNLVGWSSYSPVLFALVASEPSAPRSPYLIRSTSSQITLGLFESD
jgi:hypothetical protein